MRLEVSYQFKIDCYNYVLCKPTEKTALVDTENIWGKELNRTATKNKPQTKVREKEMNKETIQEWKNDQQNGNNKFLLANNYLRAIGLVH